MISMEYRDIGTSDLKVSVVGLGCNNFGARMDLAAARALVHHAVDRGINHFDTADIYGPRGKSEEILGEILGSWRKDIVIATKFGMPFDEARTMKGASRNYIMTAVEGSLRRLKTDYIDLYYQHTPDPSVPIEETLRALDELVRQGKVRHIGNSNFNGKQIDAADAAAKKLGITRFICAQDELSLIKRHSRRSVFRRCRKTRLRWCRISRSPAACSPASTAAAPRCRPVPGSPPRTGSRTCSGRKTISS
jgi:aryl-alcohol dehydrogenase-like predicted oxidoreductase